MYKNKGGKMRKLIIALGFLLLFSNASYAVSLQQSFGDSKKSPSIKLYKFPELKSIVLQKVLPEEVIPIYYTKDWIKVGEPSNGQVGWINRAQYRKAFGTYYQPDIRTMFIRTEYNDQGKPVVNVTAYQNGKKLSDEETKKLYLNFKKQRIEQELYIQKTFHQLNHLITEQMREMNKFVDPLSEDLWSFDPTVIQPVIILAPSEQKASPSTKRVEKSE